MNATIKHRTSSATEEVVIEYFSLVSKVEERTIGVTLPHIRYIWLNTLEQMLGLKWFDTKEQARADLFNAFNNENTIEMVFKE